MIEKAIEAALEKQFRSRLRGPDGGVSIFKNELPAMAKEIGAALALHERPAISLTEAEAQAIAGLDRWQKHGGQGPFLSDVRIVIDTIHRLASPPMIVADKRAP